MEFKPPVRSNSVAWRLTKSLRSHVFGAAVLYGHQSPLPHSGPRFTYAFYGSGACVLVSICPTLRAYLRGRDDWTWGLRFRSSWSWCLCPVSDCRPFVEDYFVAALESDMSSISPRMPRTLTSLAKLDPSVRIDRNITNQFVTLLRYRLSVGPELRASWCFPDPSIILSSVTTYES